MRKEAGVVVIKVGGSLLDWPELPGRLVAFLARCRDEAPVEDAKFLLVAGGGPAADLVRTLDRIHGLGDVRAHWLAVRAMDLCAEILTALLPGAAVVCRPEMLESVWNLGAVPVLAPSRFLEEIDACGPDRLAESWLVTSDSIAARIAVILGGRRLILLKSKGLPPDADREDAARLGLVDPMFPAVARELELVELVCLRDDPPTRQLLSEPRQDP
jgi:aspartokinase-like uncharacterized kinase